MAYHAGQPNNGAGLQFYIMKLHFLKYAAAYALAAGVRYLQLLAAASSAKSWQQLTQNAQLQYPGLRLIAAMISYKLGAAIV